MAACDRGSAQIRGPVAPAGERVEPGIGRQTLRTPQGEHGTADLFAGGAIGFIVLQIASAAGAVVFAHGMDPPRILVSRMIMRERTRIEKLHTLRLGARPGAKLEKVFRT